MTEPEPIKLALAPTPEVESPAAKPAAAPEKNPSAFLWILVALIFAAGVLVRVWPSAGFTGTGFDEALYRDNVIKLDKTGLFNYSAVCQLYIEDQRNPESITKLPPTRFFYIAAAWMWKRAEFGDAPPVSPRTPEFTQRDPALVALHRVATLFSCLGLLVSGLCAWRMLGLRALPGVLALLAVSPLSIHLGQHAMIDGVFAFWAMLNLWLLWENLQQPNNTRLLAAYGTSLAAMVMTKENSFFVYMALCGLLMTNHLPIIFDFLGDIVRRPMRNRANKNNQPAIPVFGYPTKKLVIVTVVGPALGLLTLVLLAGGLAQFSEIYRLLVSKAQNLVYAIRTGDGPWYRYLLDLLVLSPLVLVFAVGGAFSQLRNNKPFVFLVAFVGFSYLIMCNVRYGMNLRYTSIWDLPIRALAAAQITAVATRFGRWKMLATVIGIVGLCAYDLRQYLLFFADGKLYETVPGDMLQVIKVLKFK